MAASVANTGTRVINSAIRSRKQSLRKSVTSLLRELTTSDVDQQCMIMNGLPNLPKISLTSFLATLIFQRLTSFPTFKKSKSVGCYLSMPTCEAATTTIVDCILHAGMGTTFIVTTLKRDAMAGNELYTPKIRSKESSVMDVLRVYSVEDLASFPAGTWGIREPGDQFQGQTREGSKQNQDQSIVCTTQMLASS